MENNNLDKFSSLPECIHLSIISLLSFKDAVRTCILSKHWLHLWKKSSCIEFHENLIDHSETFGSIIARRSAFMSFIRLWPDHPKECVVKKFSLRFSNPTNVHHLEIITRCITFVMSKHLKELELDFSDPIWEEVMIPNKRAALFELPTIAYKHESNVIESLKLSSCAFLESGLSNWKALKDVTFEWMEVTVDAMETVLSNCNLIETLVLKKCWNMSHCQIGDKALSLKTLVLYKCSFKNALIKVNAPNLCFFKYTGKLVVFKMRDTLVIEEAHLNFYLGYNEDGLASRILYNLVKDLNRARVLSLCPYLFKVIRLVERTRMKRDMNTRHLTLKMNMFTCEFRAISFFLQSCPLLDSLTFELGSEIVSPDYQAMWIDSDEDQDDLPMLTDSDEEEEEDDQIIGMDTDEDEDEQAMSMDSDDDDDDYKYLINMVDNQFKGMKNVIYYECLELSLKTVDVKDFVASKNELFFLCYLIRFGKVLKTVNINVLKGELDESKNVTFYRAIEEYLMTTPRASSDLQISICYFGN